MRSKNSRPVWFSLLSTNRFRFVANKVVYKRLLICTTRIYHLTSCAVNRAYWTTLPHKKAGTLLFQVCQGFFCSSLLLPRILSDLLKKDFIILPQDLWATVSFIFPTVLSSKLQYALLSTSNTGRFSRSHLFLYNDYPNVVTTPGQVSISVSSHPA